MLPLPPEQLAAAAAVLVGGAALQTAVGFGMGMFSVPLLLWLGFLLPDAVGLFLGGSVAQTAFASHRTRGERHWPSQARFGVGQYVGVPLGVLGMAAWADATGLDARRVVGGVLLAAVLIRISVRPSPRQEVHPAWTALASVASGVLAGAVGMGGPPAVLWAMAHDWSTSRFRTFLWTQIVVVAPAVLGVLAWTHGLGVVKLAGAGLATAPLLWLVSLGAMRLTSRWTRQRLHAFAVLVLLAIAIRSLVG